MSARVKKEALVDHVVRIYEPTPDSPGTEFSDSKVREVIEAKTRELLEFAPKLDPSIIEDHLLNIFSIERYTGYFSVREIIEHIDLWEMAKDDQETKRVLIRKSLIDSFFVIHIVGYDALGVKNEVAACTKKLGLNIVLDCQCNDKSFQRIFWTLHVQSVSGASLDCEQIAGCFRRTLSEPFSVVRTREGRNAGGSWIGPSPHSTSHGRASPAGDLRRSSNEKAAEGAAGTSASELLSVVKTRKLTAFSPPSHPMEFERQVDELRADVRKLEQRLERVESTVNENNKLIYELLTTMAGQREGSRSLGVDAGRPNHSEGPTGLTPEQADIIQKVHSLEGTTFDACARATTILRGLEGQKATKPLVDALKALLKDRRWGIVCSCKEGAVAAPVWHRDSRCSEGGFLKYSHADASGGTVAHRAGGTTIPLMVVAPRRK